ncbi:hypothetical protein DPMN_088349 [Dreissena polymorpha]|uniref:Uncharacterized protein n=1 Tax=Dreissena polymorpha TaxID=45954 RepID=A0A9D4KW14_DREPO|nr:hypothetical protein DPMN_088349 [Dreissena polymorpha]
MNHRERETRELVRQKIKNGNRIGVFTMPCKSNLSVSEIRLSRNGVSACLRIIVALSVLLLLCGDVEQNPNENQRQATPENGPSELEPKFKARSHRQNFAGAFLERYEEGPNFGNAHHRAQKWGKKSTTRALPKRCTAEASAGDGEEAFCRILSQS